MLTFFAFFYPIFCSIFLSAKFASFFERFFEPFFEGLRMRLRANHYLIYNEIQDEEKGPIINHYSTTFL